MYTFNINLGWCHYVYRRCLFYVSEKDYLPWSNRIISTKLPREICLMWTHSQIDFPEHLSGMFSSLHIILKGTSSGCVRRGEGGNVKVILLILYILNREFFIPEKQNELVLCKFLIKSCIFYKDPLNVRSVK